MPARAQLRRDAGKVGPPSGPWVRARQIARWIGVPDPCEPVEVVDRHGEPLGWGLPSEQSAIAVRMLSWGPEPLPPNWLSRRLQRAVAARETLGLAEQPTTGMRLVNSEGDGLPGLVVDRYGSHRVVQLTTAPMAVRQQAIVDGLRALGPGPVHVVRPPFSAQLEGFEPGVEREGEAVQMRYVEHGLQLGAPTPPSQKTGAYLDQRANRRHVAQLARRAGAPLLDLGCHVGGFALHAAAAGVPAVGVDQSAAMLEHAAEHATVNGLTEVTWVKADMFGALDDPRLVGPFGTVVVDPPKVATRRRDVDRAMEAMRRMVGRAASRLMVDGYLVLCSCSHHLGRDHLDRCVLAAAGHFTRVATLGADVDHPVAPGHVEGEYLRVGIYQRRR